MDFCWFWWFVGFVLWLVGDVICVWFCYVGFDALWVVGRLLWVVGCFMLKDFGIVGYFGARFVAMLILWIVSFLRCWLWYVLWCRCLVVLGLVDSAAGLTLLFR